MRPISGIEFMKGEVACVSNMRKVTVYYDQENLRVEAKITHMTIIKMDLPKSCSCRVIKI